MALAELLILLFLLVFWIAIPIWTYRDAGRNSSQSAFLWALVVFLAPLLGLVLYALLGREADGGGRPTGDVPPQYRR